MVGELETPTRGPTGAGEVPDEVFRLVVDGTATPFVLIDRDGTIRYVSGSIETVLGWRADQLVGRNMVEFLPEDQVETAIQAVAEIDEFDRIGAGVPITFAISRPDGERAWFDIGAMPFLDVPEIDLIALRLRPWDAEHHMAEFLTTLLTAPSLDAVLGPLSRSIAASLQAAGAAIHHGFDGRAFGGTVGSWDAAADLPLDVGPWCDAARELRDVDRDDVDGGELGRRTCWSVPVAGNGAVAPAVLSVWRAEPERRLMGHHKALDRLTSYVQLALVRTAEHQRLLHLAGHDSLTGVANRASFRDRLAQALAIGERHLAVAFCDLDRFKPVNDTYGHRTGDEVLVEVARRLRQTLRVGDELARIGGDEFTVLMRNVPDAATARHVADRLLTAVEAPFAVPGGEVRVGLSAGVALADRGATADSLLATADAALYACKRAGGSRCAVIG
jgi:diguanylate cyclase (GGDEF)-like protein/PAS domain S-box-containing protein